MNEEIKYLSVDELEEVSGGATTNGLVIGNSYTTFVKTGYLALRSAMAYDAKNEIGPLWNGSLVSVQANPIGDYVWVYVLSAAKGAWGVDVTGKSGYVNRKYLQA